MKKISIIIPVYNAEKFLEKLFTSILNQTYNNYEVVLVNDGSTDNSHKIIENYKSKSEKIKCITIENSGPGIARKIGFENSTGELLFFIDSDDFLPKDNILEEISEIYDKSNFDILIFNFIRKYNEKENIVNAFFSKNIKEGLQSADYLKKNDLAGALWCKIFKREKMKSEYFYDANNYEDYYTTYKYLEECNNFYYTNKIFYYANRDNQNSISKKNNYNKIYKTVDLLKEMYNFSKYKDAVMIIIYNYYMFVRRNIDKSQLSKEEKREKVKKIKELNKFINVRKILRSKLNIKEKLKCIYYIIKDFIGECKI